MAVVRSIYVVLKDILAIEDLIALGTYIRLWTVSLTTVLVALFWHPGCEFLQACFAFKVYVQYKSNIFTSTKVYRNTIKWSNVIQFLEKYLQFSVEKYVKK